MDSKFVSEVCRKRSLVIIFFISIGSLLVGMLHQQKYTSLTTCPTENNFNEFWNNWSIDYLTENPGIDVDTQMDDWNAIMVTNNCGDEWLNPLDDLINDYLASSTNNGKTMIIPVPPLEAQQQIVDIIEVERAHVESARTLIDLYTQKTTSTIAKLWSE